MILFKYLIRELINQKRFSLLFVLNMTLGLSGFIALDGFKASIDSTIKGRSKAVLGADFGLSSRRPFSDAEVQQIDKFLPPESLGTESIEMVSMVANKQGRSRLVQIKAIEKAYPFYGDILLQKNGLVTAAEHNKIFEQPGVWIYPELTRQLGVEIGDKIRIGSLDLVVRDIVESDAAAGLSTNMAPRIYLNKKFIKQTKLLREGSIAWYSRLYKIPKKNSEQLNEIRDQLFKELDRPEIKVYTHENASAQMVTLISRLNDFLGLSSLVALFLATVGSTFLFFSWFRQRVRQIATLMSLGLSKTQAFLYYLTQVILLGGLSSVVAIFLSLFLVPGLGSITKNLLPFDIEFFISPSTILIGVLVGTVGCLFLSLPVLAGLRNIHPKLLLAETQQKSLKFSLAFALACLPGIGFFIALSIQLAHSLKIGLLFSGLFVASALILCLVSWGLLKAAEKAGRGLPLPWNWIFRDLVRQPSTTLTCFVTIGLGALLLNLVPQIQTSLSAELQRPEESKLPSLFMFDIQEEQLNDFKNILKQESVTVDQISPTIRARLISVNGEEFDKGEGSKENLSREEEREMRFRNRGFNLSYREKLSDAETLVSGRDFSGIFDPEKSELAEISVEQRFADRLNFKMNDILEFEIESIPVRGKIINLRKVNWTSFQPNFFVQFQPGVLEMAPKTFIATLPGMNQEMKFNLQDLLVKELPNISMVDVSRIVKKISEIINQMSFALTFMALLCLFSGFVVIYSIANHQSRQRQWEIGLLKSLGTPFSVIEKNLCYQFTITGVLALATGAGMSLILSFILSLYLFESRWIFNLEIPLVTLIIGGLLTYFVSQWAIQGALKKKTRDLFSSENSSN